MLSNEITVKLIRLAKSGDNDAKEQLIINNQSLLKSIVKRFKGRGVEYDDLYQLASIGFLKAIANFDESFEVRFSTYAVPMIVGEIKRFLRDDGSVKVSRIIKGLGTKINRYLEELKQKDLPAPTIEQLCEMFEVEKEDVVMAIGSTRQVVSIYDSVGGDDDKPIELLDVIESGEKEDDMLDRIMLRRLIDELPDREKKIILMRYFSDRTQSEIAKELGVSQVQVSRLESKIVDKLRRKIS